MPKPPRITSRRQLLDSGMFHIEEMALEFSNGAQRNFQRIVGSRRGAVLVVPMPSDHELILIREYAAGMERYELGFPKGSIDAGEDALEAANRECREEIGLAARRLDLIRSLTVAPGYLYHETHLVLARDLHAAPLPGDEPEPVECVNWPLADLNDLLHQPDFTEARSIAALFLVRDWLARDS